jgi:hypothetical protein
MAEPDGSISAEAIQVTFHAISQQFIQRDKPLYSLRIRLRGVA